MARPYDTDTAAYQSDSPTSSNPPLLMMQSTTRRRGEPLTLATLPSELQLHVMSLLNAIDATCFGLTSKHFYKLYRVLIPTNIALTTGSPTSATPVIKRTGCKYCVPVLWYPAHCELRNHLARWMPPDLEYCMNCKLFTPAPAYDEVRRPWKRFCAKCGEDLGNQESAVCRERLQEDRIMARVPGETRWPRYYGDRSPPPSREAG